MNTHFTKLRAAGAQIPEPRRRVAVRTLIPEWINLEKPGRLRASNVQALLNVSRATFYAGIKSGRYPSPDGHDGSMPFWLTSTIRPLVG